MQLGVYAAAGDDPACAGPDDDLRARAVFVQNPERANAGLGVVLEMKVSDVPSALQG
jgi:hypothetical protein